MHSTSIRFLILAFLFAVEILFSQPAPKSNLDLYTTALLEASKEMDRQWSGMAANPGQDPIDYKHLLVNIDASVRADYPQMADGRRYEFLTTAQILARRRKARNDFPVLEVQPATIEGPRVKVRVVVFWTGLEKRNLTLGYSDWAEVFFRFDSAKGEFRLDRVQLGGI